MVQTKEGGLKAAKSNLEKYGEDYYRNIGSLGGRAKVPKGFALNRERASIAGRKGGLKSKRTGVTTGQGKKREYCYNGDGRFANVQEGA